MRVAGCSSREQRRGLYYCLWLSVRPGLRPVASCGGVLAFAEAQGATFSSSAGVLASAHAGVCLQAVLCCVAHQHRSKGWVRWVRVAFTVAPTCQQVSICAWQGGMQHNIGDGHTFYLVCRWLVSSRASLHLLRAATAVGMLLDLEPQDVCATIVFAHVVCRQVCAYGCLH